MFVLHEKIFIQCVRLVLVDHVHHYDHSGPEKIKAYYFLFMLMVTDKKQQGKKAFIEPNTKFIYWKSWRSWLSWFSMRSFCTLKLKDSHDCNILLYHSKSRNQPPLSLDVVVVVFLQG